MILARITRDSAIKDYNNPVFCKCMSGNYFVYDSVKRLTFKYYNALPNVSVLTPLTLRACVRACVRCVPRREKTRKHTHFISLSNTGRNKFNKNNSNEVRNVLWISLGNRCVNRGDVVIAYRNSFGNLTGDSRCWRNRVIPRCRSFI